VPGPAGAEIIVNHDLSIWLPQEPVNQVTADESRSTGDKIVVQSSPPAAGCHGCATVTPSGQATYIWNTNPPDPRALQYASGTSRTAACWYSNTSFSIDVNLTDGRAHDLALYALDWDSEGRTEQIQFTSAATGAVLDTESVSSFTGGVYLQWVVSGHVVIRITCEGGPNAVLSGLLFDAPTAATSISTPNPTATAIASLAQPNTAMQGNSMGTYGNIVTEIGTDNFTDSQGGLPAGPGFVADIGSYPFPAQLRVKRPQPAPFSR
jgi:hypothetical protein